MSVANVCTQTPGQSLESAVLVMVSKRPDRKLPANESSWAAIGGGETAKSSSVSPKTNVGVLCLIMIFYCCCLLVDALDQSAKLLVLLLLTPLISFSSGRLAFLFY